MEVYQGCVQVPGMCAGVPGMCAGVPGMCAGVPGMCAGVPGMCAGVPGMCAGVPGMCARDVCQGCLNVVYTFIVITPITRWSCLILHLPTSTVPPTNQSSPLGQWGCCHATGSHSSDNGGCCGRSHHHCYTGHCSLHSGRRGSCKEVLLQ